MPAPAVANISSRAITIRMPPIGLFCSRGDGTYLTGSSIFLALFSVRGAGCSGAGCLANGGGVALGVLTGLGTDCGGVFACGGGVVGMVLGVLTGLGAIGGGEGVALVLALVVGVLCGLSVRGFELDSLSLGGLGSADSSLISFG